MKPYLALPLLLLAGGAPAQVVDPRPRVTSHGALPPPLPPAGSVEALLPNTQRLFERYARGVGVAGIVGAFGVADAPTLFPEAGHVSDLPGAAAVSPDTLWRVYSMTKPITAMAAMMLIEDGRLRLDEPIAEVFPAFSKMRVLVSPDTSLASRPARAPITVRNLLTHTAGLGYTIVTKGPLLHEYERLGIVPAAINAEAEAKIRPTRPTSLAAFADRVATLPLIAEPGTKWSYSIGLDLLAAVVEKAGGMPFERFVQTRLFGPLRMTSTYWTVPRSEVGRLATNYAFVGDVRAPVDPAQTSVWLSPPSFPYGGAGLVSSARDYDRFLHMLVDGGTLDGVRVMKPETVRLALSNLLPAGVTFGGVDGGTGGTRGGTPMGFGAGGSVTLADGPGGFPAKGTYGWGGAAGTIAFVDPARRFRGTIMVNYFPADKWPLRQDTVAALAQDAAQLHGSQPARPSAR